MSRIFGNFYKPEIMSVSLFSGTFFLLLFSLETSVYVVQQYWFCHSTLFDLWLTLSDYPLVSWKFWPLHCLIFDVRFLITLWYLESFDHYIVWSLTYAFWLPFGIVKVLTITLFDLWLTLSDYPLVSSNVSSW